MEISLETVDIEVARREIAGGEALAVDVRSPEDWNRAHVPGAIHLGGEELAGVDGELAPKGARLMVIAENGLESARGAARLCELGYDAVAINGGMDDWTAKDFKTQPTSDPDEDTELGAG